MHPRVLGADRATDDSLFSRDAEKNMPLGKAGVTEKGGVVKCQQLGELSESYSMPKFSFSLFFSYCVSPANLELTEWILMALNLH